MEITKFIRKLLLTLPLAAFSSSFGGLATDMSLVSRIGREPPEGPPRVIEPYINRPILFPSSPDYQPPEINWFGTFRTLMPHYPVYDEKSEPPDTGVRPSIYFDGNKGYVVLYFGTIPGTENLEEEHGNQVRGSGGFLYRLQDSASPRKVQRYMAIPGGDPNVPETVAKGRAITDAFLIHFTQGRAGSGGPTQTVAQMRLSLDQFTAGLTPYSVALSRSEANWLENQLRIGLSTTLRKRQLSDKRRSNQRRTDPMTQIKAQEDHSNHNSTADMAAEFSRYLDAYNELQANIGNLLFPVLNELINGSINRVVYQIALSIYSDITLSTAQVVGPFKNGMTALTSIEDQYAKSTNTTIYANGTLDVGHNRTDLNLMLALHAVYEKLYISTWNKAINATNSTGMLSDLAILTGYLLPKDPSICPPGWLDTPLSFANSSIDVRAIVEYANMTQLQR